MKIGAQNDDFDLKIKARGKSKGFGAVNRVTNRNIWQQQRNGVVVDVVVVDDFVVVVVAAAAAV